MGVITKDILGELFDTHLVIGEMTQIVYKGKKFFIIPLYHLSLANPYGHKRNLNIIKINEVGIKNVLV